MKPHDRSKTQWGSKHLKRVMERAKRKMKPHAAKLETEEGMRAMLMVAGAAVLVANDIESHENMANTVKLTSIISGVPLIALNAYAEMVVAMHSGYQVSERNSPFARGGGSDE